MLLNKELVQYQNKLYYVYKKMRPGSIKDGYVNDVKDFWGCDVVVKGRNDDTLLFLRIIEDAEVVKDII